MVSIKLLFIFTMFNDHAKRPATMVMMIMKCKTIIDVIITFTSLITSYNDHNFWMRIDFSRYTIQNFIIKYCILPSRRNEIARRNENITANNNAMQMLPANIWKSATVSWFGNMKISLFDHRSNAPNFVSVEHS